MSVDKINNPVSSLEVVDKINQIIDNKQDLLSAGTSISIDYVEPSDVDTRSTATVQTVGSSSNTWQEVCYGNGKWVAVGNNGYMCVSNDGATWGTPFTVGTRKWRGIIYANNKFIACGEYGSVGVSSDGTTWTTQTVGNSTASYNWYDIIFANNSYMMVSDDGGYIATTTDLDTWSVVSKGATSKRCIAYGNGLYVCVGQDSQVSYSSDGTNWASADINFSGDGLIYAFNKFIAVGSSGGNGRIATSSDGTNWNIQTVGSTAWQEIRYANNVLVISGSGGYTSTSTDGETWTTSVKIGSTSWYGLGNNGTNYVAVGPSGGMTSFQVGEIQGGTVISSTPVATSVSSSSTNAECVSAKAVYDSLATKQDTLVSGTSIKTINNESLLGSGNINISGGSTITFRSWS